jgi:hypothetical protein
LLDGERAFLQGAEDAVHGILDGAHHEAIRERDLTRRPGAGENPAAGNQVEIAHRTEESLLPERRVVFDCGNGARDPPEGVIDVASGGCASGSR